MTRKDKTPLAPHEVLRVMDAAQVIHERRQALEEHETFDREAAIRDIQRMYEELGDLVDSETIEKALDDYLSQRYAFAPTPPGIGRSLALLYIRRGWIARRVLLPATVVGALIWGSIAGAGMMAERALAERHARLATLQAEVARLHSAVLAEAAESLAGERAASLAGEAESRIATRDVDGLEEAARRFQDLLDTVATEYRIVVTGGVWRYPDGTRDVRNHYLLVQALGTDGEPVSVTIRSEETGDTRRVRQWGERVPQEAYDRIAADKEDNGIIDDEEFGFKPRGFVTAERRYADIGQITEW